MLINNDINLTFQKILMAKYMTRQLYVILSHAGNTPGYVQHVHARLMMAMMI